MSVAGFHHVAIFVTDVEAVAAFYREVLGLPELRRSFHEDGALRSIWLAARAHGTAEDGFLAVEHAESTTRGVLGFAMFALRILPSERATFEDRLAAKGLPIERRTGWTLYVRDPEGNLVGLSHHPFDAMR